MVHCCVPGCKNTHHHKSRGKDDWASQESRNYSLHDLPNEDRMEVRELWVMAINRTTLPKDVAVCSDHFTEDCFDEKWEEYKRKYGPTKVKRKLKLDAVPTIFPGRIFIHDKVQRIKENWKNKVLQKQIEMERLRIEREYKDRFKSTQTECTCKCRCKLRKKHFGQQVNFSFKFMEDVGVQFPSDPTQAVKDDHSYHQGKSNTAAAGNGKLTNTNTAPLAVAATTKKAVAAGVQTTPCLNTFLHNPLSETTGFAKRKNSASDSLDSKKAKLYVVEEKPASSTNDITTFNSVSNKHVQS